MLPENNNRTTENDIDLSKPFPKFYRIFILGVLALGGMNAYDYIQDSTNPDKRDDITMAVQVCKTRQRINTANKQKGKLNCDPDAEPKKWLKSAKCVLDKLNFDKKEDAWRKTKKTNLLISKEEKAKGKLKYAYMENLFGHVLNYRMEDTKQTIREDRRVHEERYRWLTVDTNTFLKSHLKCVKDVDGKCMKDYSGNACLLNEMLAEQVTKANRKMYEEKKEQIHFIVCWRNDLEQALLYVAIATKGTCNIHKARTGIMLPGNSSHALGTAADIANSKQAEKYLKDIGMYCGFVSKNDKGHCSIGERKTQGKIVDFFFNR